MRARLGPPIVRVGLALAVALPALAAAPAAPVLAATPGLTLVTDARYDVRPDERRVAISVDIRATNHRRDSAIRRYYYERAFLAVMPGTTNFKISSPGARPSVRVAAREKTHTLLRIDFGRRIVSGKSADLLLRFDLPDPGGPASRQLRIGGTLTSFPVWAFASASTPGSSVTVVFPEGYEVNVESGDLGVATAGEDGTVVLRSGRLTKPLDFFAYVVAERPGDYAERRSSTTVGDESVELVLRSWEDDAPWAEHVGGLFERGLPELGRQIGLPYDGARPLVVEEAVSHSTGGYAGQFDPEAGRIEVAYYAGAFVVLHEAAHAWFNGRLLGDRWINEAFASYYALRAAGALQIEATGEVLSEELEAARVPLNAWSTAPNEDPVAEDAGYAASLALAREIAERAGEDGLRRVWTAAAAREAGYSGATRLTEAPDWRTFLDLLERHTDATYDDLWAMWVVRPEDAQLLDDRLAARAELEMATGAAAPWRLPAVVDRAMAAWRFDQAQGLLAEAREVLALRTEIESQAASAGLTPPSTLRSAFEGDGGLGLALAEGEAELSTISAIVGATAAGDDVARTEAFDQIGLVGFDPGTDLVSARELFAAGDLEAAVERAEAANATWLRAQEIGRNRILAGVAGLLVVFAVILLVTSRLRRTRPERLDREEGPAPAR